MEISLLPDVYRAASRIFPLCEHQSWAMFCWGRTAPVQVDIILNDERAAAHRTCSILGVEIFLSFFYVTNFHLHVQYFVETSFICICKSTAFSIL